MESTTGSRSVSLRWKLLILIPLAVAVVLAVISSRQTDLHAGNKLTIIANLFVPVSLITQALYWILVKKWTVGDRDAHLRKRAAGVRLHVLLRVLTH
jgi:drug/metabolite transporter (DMT)-like permease